MTNTQSQISVNMIQQLRLLDPAVSCEIGTPERKILDTVAQELANAQIDLSQVEGVFDLESKFGTDLENFLSIFGFARQSGSQAVGFITLSREVESEYRVPIPLGTQVQATTETEGGNTISVLFATTAFGEIEPNEKEVVIPIQCLVSGTIGNIAAGTINSFARTPILGVTTVTNEISTRNGSNAETDAELKVRFKNTVFRNLAGTEDQYLALAVATQYSTKANVVGPISRYQEYIQVPNADDASEDPENGYSGNGNPGQWTTAMSTIPYSKFTYTTVPYYLTNGDTSEVTTTFFREEVDFIMNTTEVEKDRGDTYREEKDDGGLKVSDPGAQFQPNITLFNVYQGLEEGVIAPRPGDIMLFEHAYMSDSSRNNYERQILNCVDVYINGRNPVQADAVTVKPNATYVSTNTFVTDPTSRFYYENFRRVGEPERRPVVGNFFFGLFWTPILSAPEQIVTASGTYVNGIHYWVVEDVSELKGSVRARTGIEWNSTIFSAIDSTEIETEQFTGPTIVANEKTKEEEIPYNAKPLLVNEYTYDRNIVDLQSSLEANKQITTDVLGHQAKIQYLKMDLTVMYTQGSSASSVNSQIQSAISEFLNGSYFGTTIQLSDILQVVHNLSGVDNVRWSREVLEADSKTEDAQGNPRFRVVECDEKGVPLCNFLIDRRNYGWKSGEEGAKEVQIGYFTGNPTKGSIHVIYKSHEGAIEPGMTAAEVETALDEVTVTGKGTPKEPYVFTFTAKAYREIMSVSKNTLQGSTSISETTVFDSDFILKDDELPALPTGTVSGDTLPGVIIRKKAANTWNNY